jgi:hypothetical protein
MTQFSDGMLRSILIGLVSFTICAGGAPNGGSRSAAREHGHNQSGLNATGPTIYSLLYLTP